MPRIRTLKPEALQHRKVGPLSDRAFRLWISMITQADDEGRLVCEAEQLRALAFGYHRRVTTTHVEGAIQEIAHTGLISLYVVNDTRYAYFPSWQDHQSIDRPTASKLPSPNHSMILRRVLDEDSRRKGTEGKGTEGNETTMSSAAAPLQESWGTPEALVALYNEATPEECPAVETLSPARREKARKYLALFGKRTFWQEAFSEIHKSRFLRGLLKRPGHEHFVASFDWLLMRGKDGVENVIKVREAKYRDGQ